MISWLRVRGIKEIEAKLQAEEHWLIPFWVFESGESGERSLLAVDFADLPLAPTGSKPAGQLEHFDPDDDDPGDARVLEPTVPIQSALARLELDLGSTGEGSDSRPPSRVRLVYVSYREFRYSYGNLSFTAFVELTTGAVHAQHWPSPRNPQLDRKLAITLTSALVLYTGTAFFLDGFVLPFIVSLVLSVPLWWVLVRFIDSSRSTP